MRPGDWIFLDIDQTLLKTSKDRYGPDSIIIDLDPKVAPVIKNMLESYSASEVPEKQIHVILLTARDSKYEQQTRDQLVQIGFPGDIEIIFAPNLKTAEGKVITKGNALEDRLQGNNPKRIIIVDDLKENLIDIQKSLSNSTDLQKIPLILFHKLVGHKMYESVDSSIFFPNNFDNF